MVMVNRRGESGAVSLFLVIFAMLLITIVTLSFLRTMINDQQQASAADLSQSARDSALAGIEDAKRELIYYRTLCSTGDVDACGNAKTSISQNACNAGLGDVVSLIPGRETEEVPVQQSQSSTNDKRLNQYYTCVKMALETVDYKGYAAANKSRLIPLKSTAAITSVTIQWYLPEDLGSTSKAVNLLGETSADTAKPLYQQAKWVAARPSLLRVQLMQFGSDDPTSGFTLSDFDKNDDSNAINSNANTIFLYPVKRAVASSANVSYAIASEDTRQIASGSPKKTRCLADLSGGGYACTATLTLPQAIGQTNDKRTAYLRITPLYNATNFRVTLGSADPVGTPIVMFDGVQPAIDSTGRANDLYRRIESRVDLTDTSFPFPEAAVDLTSELCKDFIVTATAGEAQNNCSL